MKLTKIALSLLAGIGAGCSSVPPAPSVAMSNLPNCFDSSYDKERRLFTLRDTVGSPVNQQCLLAVGPPTDVVSDVLGGIWDAVTGLFTAGPSVESASASRLTPGMYTIYYANGGGGGAGGTLQAFTGGGGGGGGGAGAKETRAAVYLTEGIYKLTLGAGGPGGTACSPSVKMGGGFGWAGSASNMVRVATGEVVIGTPGADRYVRPTRARNERMAGKIDGHGGSGPEQTSGGHGSTAATPSTLQVAAEPGQSQLASGAMGVGGEHGQVSIQDKQPGAGGGGGATSMGHGGGGGGESPGQAEVAPERGSLGSGGGGGEGSRTECDPGARGGHGYIALRRN